MPFKVVKLQEWKALGLPTEISSIYFESLKLCKKVKEQNKKKDKKKCNK